MSGLVYGGTAADWHAAYLALRDQWATDKDALYADIVWPTNQLPIHRPARSTAMNTTFIPRAGDVGEEGEEWEILPATEPVHVPEPEPEKVPATPVPETV